MISVTLVTLATFAYIALLFAAAFLAVRQRQAGRSIISNATIYVLSLGVWHTSWTFYGNVGRVATVGIDFLAIYLGATLIISCWWILLRKMVRISKEQNIVSIADFIASRYGKSTGLGAMVAIFAVLGTLPYIALQLKGVAKTFELLSAAPGTQLSASSALLDTAFWVALILALFSILFGARHLDPSERHEGLVAAIALESVVKILAMLAVGLFITFGLFSGPGEIFTRFLTELPDRRQLLLLGTDQLPFSSWLSLGVTCMMAFMFLPHMFHLMVVENADEEHIKSAMWRFPLYMFLIVLFIIPIALGGLVLSGGDTTGAEYFSIQLPLQQGHHWLALLVFLGGFSGSAGMVMVASVALSTMILNQLVMPLLLRVQPRGADLSGLLLGLKRLGILGIMLLSYCYYRLLAGQASLVDIGTISFVGATQFAPLLLGGLFWKRANLKGASWGLLLGFAAWFYTLLVPAMVRAGWLPGLLLEQGPWNLSWLRPEALFGLEGLPSLPHALFWSLLLNVGSLLCLSHLTRPKRIESEQALKFVDVFSPALQPEPQRQLSGAPRVMEFVELMSKFIGEKKAQTAIAHYLENKEIDLHGSLSEKELPALKEFTERTLTGSVGSAPARIIIENYLASRGSRMQDVFDIFGSVTISRKMGREQLGVLHETARIVAGGDALQTILTNILRLLQEQFKLDLCVIRMLDQDQERLTVRCQRGMSSHHLGEGERALDMSSYVGATFLSNTLTVVNDTDYLEKDMAARIIHREGIKSFAHAPITVEGSVVGVLSAFSRTSKGIFSDEFMELFKNLAGQVGVAWRNAEQTEHLISAREQEREIQIARTVQQGLLPNQVPAIAGIALAGICLPAKQVGGDYYDFLARDEQTIDLVIADVSGHNVGAAIIMTEVRTFIRAVAPGLATASEIAAALNSFLYDDLTHAELFITMFYLKYHAERRQLTFANAGHNPPLLYRTATQECQKLDAEGLIFGIKPEVSFEQRQVQLQPGDVLLLYTDGITEAEASVDNFFGEERLAALLGEFHRLPPAQLIDKLLEQVRLFTGKRNFPDDLSLVVMRVED
jgi:serine phosphatase RsbU (regulator of sigma subunit)/Na+/proline symporter